MDESRYWNRFGRRRMSRRGVIRGAALGRAGRAASAVVGCSSGSDTGGNEGGGGDKSGNQGFDNGEDLVAQAVNPYDARRKLTPPPGPTGRGGFLRYQGFDAVVLDRFDPHQTQFGPMYANQSSVFSKLYLYRSHREPTWENIVPDLAEKAPEMIGDPN